MSGYWDLLKRHESSYSWRVGRNWTVPAKQRRAPRELPWKLFSFILLILVIVLLFQGAML